MPRRKPLPVVTPDDTTATTETTETTEITEITEITDTPGVEMTTPAAPETAVSETPTLPPPPPKAIDTEVVIAVPGARLVRVRFEQAYDGENGNLVLRFHRGQIAQLPQHVVQTLKRRSGLITVLE